MGSNEFNLDGIRYKAIPIRDTMSCDGCAAIESGSDLCAKLPPCYKAKRVDGVSVIFVEKQQ